MKTTRKLLAMVLAAVMILSLCVTAFATNSDGESYDKGSITIKNPQENETYKAYKIFDVTYDLGGTGSDDDRYAYTIAPEWVDDVQAYVGNTKGTDGTYPAITAKGLTITPVKDTSGVVVYNVARVPDDPATTDVNEDIFSAADFGEAMAEESSGKTAVTFNGAKAENLDLGYYMVQPTTANSLVSLTTTDADVVVSDKNEKPEVDKSILEEGKVLDCTNTDEGHVHDDTCYKDVEEEVDHTTASVGDKIPYQLETKVPDMTGYKTYFFVVNDTMSEGLTFNDDVKILIGGEDQTQKELVKGTDYSVKTTTDEDGKTNIRIVFNNMKQYWSDVEAEDWAGEPIVITYSATVDEDAVMGTVGNPNKAFIEFSNNPNVNPEYDPENPPEDEYDPKDPNYKHNDPNSGVKDPTGKGPEDETTVYSTELELTKVNADDTDETLTGAKFKIEGEKLNVTIVNKEIFIESTDGTYYRLKDGTYTEEVPDGDASTDAKEPTYAEYTGEKIEYKELTGAQAVANEGLYFSTDGGTTKTLITASNKDSVPAGAKIYQPTYLNVGLYYKEGDNYLEVTEANAAEHLSDTLYSKTVYKQSDLYEDTSVKYKKVEEITKNNSSESYEAEGFVDENGKLSFAGLAEGTYYITELVAPDGFNLLKEPIKVDVTLVDGETAGTYAFEAKIDDAATAVKENDGKISFQVENSQGIELPEAGGIGTTIFYVLGAALVLGGIIVFVTKKRMEA